MDFYQNDFWAKTFYKRIASFQSGYRQNVAILSDNKNQISGLLDTYLASKKPSELIHIRINPAHLNKNGMLKAVSFSLLSEYCGISTNLDQLINNCAEFLPETAALIKTFLQKDLEFSDLLSLINKFIQESNQNCLFILEEFLEAKNIFANFYPAFANFAISQRRCMLILASSQPLVAAKTLGNELNLLFGNFEKIYLNQNNFFDNFLFFKNRPELPPFMPDFFSFLIYIAGNNQSYCRLFLESIKAEIKNPDQTMLELLEKLLLNEESYLFQKFYNQIARLKYHFKNETAVIKLLYLLSKGYMRKNSLKELCAPYSHDISANLNKLVTLGYLNKNGSIYKISDSLFSFWLAQVFKFYSVTPVFDPKKKKQLWQKEILAELNLFREDFYKNRLKKVLELFMAFRNDSLALGKNRYNLPQLEKVKIISYPENDFHLLIGEGKKIIFAGIKEKVAQDQDILDFIQKGTSVKGKNVQKIFISLDKLTDTAKLLAKENKIPLWNKVNVNRLLEIYNKPGLYTK